MEAILLYKNYLIEHNDKMIKGIVHPKMKILSLITHPHFVPNPSDLCSSSEQKLRCFWWNPRTFWPCKDSSRTTTFKVKCCLCRVRKISDFIKISLIKFMFRRQTKVWRVWNDMIGWVINDRILIFGWTIPLIIVCGLILQTETCYF